jgi:hypothetical protein
MRAPEVGLPLLGGPLSPQRKPKINLSRSVVGRAALRCPIRAVRDSTLVTWYRSVDAPRTGGADDSHHRAAGIAGRTRRRYGRVAARGVCAAARPDEAYRSAEWDRSRSRSGGPYCFILKGACRAGLGRRSKRQDRISLGTIFVTPLPFTFKISPAGVRWRRERTYPREYLLSSC